VKICLDYIHLHAGVGWQTRVIEAVQHCQHINLTPGGAIQAEFHSEAVSSIAVAQSVSELILPSRWTICTGFSSVRARHSVDQGMYTFRN